MEVPPRLLRQRNKQTVTRRIALDKTELTLDALLAELDGDTEIVLMHGDDPIAKIAPIIARPQGEVRVLGLHEGQGWISDDFMDALSVSFWLGEDA